MTTDDVKSTAASSLQTYPSRGRSPRINIIKSSPKTSIHDWSDQSVDQTSSPSSFQRHSPTIPIDQSEISGQFYRPDQGSLARSWASNLPLDHETTEEVLEVTEKTWESNVGRSELQSDTVLEEDTYEAVPEAAWRVNF